MYIVYTLFNSGLFLNIQKKKKKSIFTIHYVIRTKYYYAGIVFIYFVSIPLQKIIRLFRELFFLLLLFIFISIEYKMRVQICVINHKMCNFNGKRSTFKLNFFIIFNGNINFVSIIKCKCLIIFSYKNDLLMKKFLDRRVEPVS